MRPWFRFWHMALDDPKVQRLPGDLFKAWVNILCLGIADGLGIDDARIVDLEVHRLRGVVPPDCVIVGVGEAMP